MTAQHLQTGFYKPRTPQKTSFYQLVERYYGDFERLYPDQQQRRTLFRDDYGSCQVASSVPLHKYLTFDYVYFGAERASGNKHVRSGTHPLPDARSAPKEA